MATDPVKNTSAILPTCSCVMCQDARLETKEYPHNFRGPLDPYFRYGCDLCGNKRCPHHTDHRLTCKRSNEPGQAGSVYA